MNGIAIRPATGDELGAVAELRWDWVLENGGLPAVTREEFTKSFASWARENAVTHRCVVMVRDDEIIGMAWLAVVQRVPTPHSPARASGDLQSVYIVPEERGNGLGSLLIDAVLRLAHDRGLERVTVHSSVRAIPAYSRRGFVTSPRLLQADLADPT
ncbi:GNAT family N-acetyltransferase [Haloechinothrix sp. YIM 98757]|uniref:GNAT family N-acetyltransferase n=1 Tax=Haloechinothrix aidingensis TaxID=2752311 RepID=A0A838AE77_9PSEU|nr:GNAT family N-acetyltransferase [Haloechinothrix aidingensis]MBA0127624.1 GNAT family N-acetyltransferase [Haloechinothrix aidingensis]